MPRLPQEKWNKNAEKIVSYYVTITAQNLPI